MIARYVSSSCLSICLSVTSQSYTTTQKHANTIQQPRHTSLLMPKTRVKFPLGHCQRAHQTEVRIFDHYLTVISETVQDRDILTMKC